MKIKKYMAVTRLILCMLTLIIIFSSCSNENDKSKNDISATVTENSVDEEISKELFKLAIFPSSTYRETYVITVYENEIIDVNFGTRISNDVFSADCIKSEKYKEAKLTTENIETLNTLVEEICNGNTDLNKSSSWDDVWVLRVLYNNDIYERIIMHDNNYVDSLISEITKVSPLDIDLHGWS